MRKQGTRVPSVDLALVLWARNLPLWASVFSSIKYEARISAELSKLFNAIDNFNLWNPNYIKGIKIAVSLFFNRAVW